MSNKFDQKNIEKPEITVESSENSPKSDFATPFYNMGVTKFLKIHFPLLLFTKNFKKICIALLNLFFYIKFIIMLYKIYGFVIYERFKEKNSNKKN